MIYLCHDLSFVWQGNRTRRTSSIRRRADAELMNMPLGAELWSSNAEPVIVEGPTADRAFISHCTNTMTSIGCSSQLDGPVQHGSSPAMSER